VPAAPAPALSDRFALIIEGLCHAVARRIGVASLGGIAGPLILLIVSRLRRYAARFTRLMAFPPARREAPRRARPRRPQPPLQSPRGKAWLLRLAPETAPIAAQLRHLLAEPEMTALLAVTPELRRTLRPLCQMLGIRPSPPAPPAAAGHAAPCHSIIAQPPAPTPPPATLAFALAILPSPNPILDEKLSSSRGTRCRGGGAARFQPRKAALESPGGDPEIVRRHTAGIWQICPA
jgi:hypothetical protein